MPFGQFTIPGFNPYAPMIQIPAGGDPGVSGMPAGAPPAPAPQGRFQGLLSALAGPGDPSMDPAAQQALNNQFLLNLGGGLLAGSRSGQGFGGIFGNALLGAQQAKRQGIDDQLNRVLLKAKLKQAQQEDKGDLVTVIGEDGNPQYVRASDAVGMRPYANQGTQAAPPASIQEYQQAVSQGYKGTFKEFVGEISKARVGAPYTQGEFGGARGAFNRTTGGFDERTSAEIEAEVQRRMAAAQAGGKVTGDAQAQAEIGLPAAQGKAQLAIKNIDDLLASPGLKYITDKASLLPIVPGTSQADADALAKNLQGKTFLEAIRELKGTGQVTVIEGDKAEAALARLQRAQSTAAYKAALKELRGTVEEGLKRQAAAAGGGAAPSAPQGGGPVRKYNPATGKIE